jgi:hypothetical protein
VAVENSLKQNIDHMLRLIEYKVLGILFVSKKENISQLEASHIYSSPSIIWEIETKNEMVGGGVEKMGRRRHTRIFIYLNLQIITLCLSVQNRFCVLQKEIHLYTIWIRDAWILGFIFWRANVYSFVLMDTQHRKGVAYGVMSGPTNRNTVTKAGRRGVATHKQQDGGT